jgi:hypothetical protein
MKRRPAAPPPTPAPAPQVSAPAPQNPAARQAVAWIGSRNPGAAAAAELPAWNAVPVGAVRPLDVRRRRELGGPRAAALSPLSSTRGALSPSPSKKEFYCELCRKPFGTGQTLETHKGTKKHKENAKARAGSPQLPKHGGVSPAAAKKRRPRKKAEFVRSAGRAPLHFSPHLTRRPPPPAGLRTWPR